MAIEAENISKSFKLYDSPVSRLKEALHPLSKRYHQPFQALNDVSFSVGKGETVGVVGKNGSGKSTLLKIVTGILQPTSGSIRVNGRVSALLELGAGFNPELTGVQNVFLHGTIMGFPREEIESRLEEVIKFADIGEFVHQPVKTYSSGMFVRLAFAVATSIHPEILIVDEALSVGDMFFQAKSSKRMKSLISDFGTTLLFVSHEMSSVKSLCSRALYLREGELIADGDSGDVCDIYVKDQRARLGLFRSHEDADDESTNPSRDCTLGSDAPFSEHEVVEFAARVADGRQGSGRASIVYADIFDASGNPTSLAFFGQKLFVRIYFRTSEDLAGLVMGCYIRDTNQVEVTGSNNIYEGCPISDLKAGVIYCCEFAITNYLKAGTYCVKLILADALPTRQFYDLLDNAVVFRAADLPDQPRWALVSPPIPVRCFSVSKNEEAA